MVFLPSLHPAPHVSPLPSSHPRHLPFPTPLPPVSPLSVPLPPALEPSTMPTRIVVTSDHNVRHVIGVTWSEVASSSRSRRAILVSAAVVVARPRSCPCARTRPSCASAGRPPPSSRPEVVERETRTEPRVAARGARRWSARRHEGGGATTAPCISRRAAGARARAAPPRTSGGFPPPVEDSFENGREWRTSPSTVKPGVAHARQSSAMKCCGRDGS